MLDCIYMENENDTLSRTAHAFGITDVDFDERNNLLRQMALEEEDRQALKEFPESEDLDWGFHDQFEM